LLSQILPHVGEWSGKYFEPFLGAGTLLLDLTPDKAVVSDACEPLINAWEAIKADPEGVHFEATKYALNKETYYIVRSMRGGSQVERAGRFIYLNKGAFNGLYRVNGRGEFNVPWGAPKSPFICNLNNLVAVSRYLNENEVAIHSGDFEDHINVAKSGDMIFVDPPYVTSHSNNGFIAYNESIFKWDDQVRLAESCARAVEAGVIVMITNAPHPKVMELYPGFDVVMLERASTLAASNAKRGRTSEVLFVSRNGSPNG
jgi:DNA adenine methylase